MAITWGSEIRSDSGNGMRLGYELTESPSTVGPATSSVVVTLKVYVWTRFSVSDSTNSVSVTGNFSWSGGVDISHGGSGGTTLARTITRTVATSYTATVKSSFSASITGINAVPGTARVAGSVTTDKRPSDPPDPATAVIAERVSDVRHVVRWTNNPAPGIPYTSIVLERWDNTQANYYAIATATGTSTSYTDSSTAANRRYRYRVRPRVGSINAPSYAYSNFITTTQTPPSGVKATKRGGDIVLDWTNNAAVNFAVEVWHSSDGVWESTRLAYLTGAPTTWTHAAPNPGVTHAYKLKAASNEPVIFSGFGSVSNSVAGLAAPAAPGNLSPASGAIDATDDETFIWTHNSVDTTEQTAYELRHRVGAGAWVATGKVASTVSSLLIPADTFTNGDTIEWQVRTWGDFATESPWSQAAIVKMSARPAVTILSPGATALSSRIVLEWLFFDNEDTTQTSYRIRLDDGAGATIWSTTANGTASSYPIPYALSDGDTYTISIAVRDGDGVWSYENSQTFTVNFADPVAPIITATWSVELGAVAIQLEHPEPGVGEVAAVGAEVWRSTGGDDWVLIAKDLEPSTSVTDFLPVLDSVNYYRVISVSATPSYRESLPVEVTTPSQGWIYVNGGPGFGRIIRMRYNPAVEVSVGRAKVRHQFAGRSLPVEFAGEAISRKVTLSSALLDDSSSRVEVEDFVLLPAPLCYRDPDGRRLFVGVDPVSVAYNPGWHSVSMSFEQVDFRE